jgi:hypothetical protein
MRICVVCLGIAVLSGLALAQSPAARDLHLRGDRFQPLTYDKLTTEQKAMVEHLLAGERGGMNGPFNVTLRSPEMGDLAQKLGAQLRFHSSLPNRLNEMAILMTARFWNAQYEWSPHKKNALTAGLNPSVIEASRRASVPARCNQSKRPSTTLGTSSFEPGRSATGSSKPRSTRSASAASST